MLALLISCVNIWSHNEKKSIVAHINIWNIIIVHRSLVCERKKHRQWFISSEILYWNVLHAILLAVPSSVILNYYHPLCIARATAVSTQKQNMFYRLLFIGENHCFPFIYGGFLCGLSFSLLKETTNFKRNSKHPTFRFSEPCVLSFPQLDKEKTKI